MSGGATAAAKRQLPHGDEIFLDHVGHFVADPDAACRALVRAGFTATPLSVQSDPQGQPTGTGNVCAMLRAGYVECLFKTADTPLAREFASAFARYPGLHLAAFAVADAAAAQARLTAAGFRARPVVHMQRPVTTQAGGATAAFTLARLEAGEMPEGRIQMLTHHTEDAVWQPRWLTHRNGAVGLVSLTIVVEDVAEVAARFARFTGRPAHVSPHGQTVALDRGQIELVTRAAFASLLPEVRVPGLPFVGSCEIAVTALATAEEVLRGNGFALRRAGDRLLVPFPPELGLGAWRFSEVASEVA